MPEKIILVTGATGKQGQAVVQNILQRGFTVRALTRNPESPAALALKSQGATVVQGNMDDLPSLRRAMMGVYGVFATQNYWEKSVGSNGELRQGRNLALAASEAQVSHFVFSSVSGCDRAKGLTHIEGKWEIEKIIQSLGLPYTFLRSVFFMENFTDPKTGPLTLPVLAGALDSSLGLHLISVKDIGWFTAYAFAHPQTSIGKTLDIAGDCLTVAQTKQVYQKVTGKKPLGFKIPLWLFNIFYPAVARQFRWNNGHGWRFDIAPLRQTHPGLIDFEHFLQMELKS